MDVVQLSQCVAETGNDDEAAKNLGEFNKKHTQSFAFPDITKDQKTKLIGALTERLSRKCSVGCYVASLNTIRILSREQAGVDDMASEASLNQLVAHAGLEAFDGDNAEEAPEKTIEDKNLPVIIEAQKCLCNILFHSPKAQRTCISNGCVEGIIQRLKTYRDQTICHEIKFFDMRILFLLTALCADIRPKIRRELHGLTYLIEVLDLCIQESSEKNVPIEDKDVDLCSEILKILFNLTVSVDKNNLAEEEEAHFLRLVSVLHDLLVCDIAAKTKREELHSHTVNLLTNMPADSYEELLTPLNEDQDGNIVNNRKQTEYDDKNVQAIVSLLEFLGRRLDKPQKSIMESLTPILHCLCETCRSNRTIRKFCRSKILPYMKEEVKKLPTEGNTLRNKLCKLLTNPITEVKDLAADLLFVLCKESVARFVKYTGYGNAAGLLAQRGLMCGGRGAEYSSDSEDSETEEYSALQDKINPITGRWEEDKPDPMAGMTEEQKEYEAMKLVEQIDELARKGLIEPCVVGTDGRPHPIEHVQQLLEGQNLNEEKKLSDEQKKTEDK